MKRKIEILVFFLLFGMAMQAQNKLYKNEFPISDVKLLDGLFKHARDLNIEVLLKYDVDRLLAPYRKVAGLPEKKQKATQTGKASMVILPVITSRQWP